MRFLLLFFLLFQCSNADKDIIPVFLIDDAEVMTHLNVEPNPFSKISTSFFADIIHDSIKRSEVVIIFVEDQLSVEDISLKDKLGTPYHHLHQGLLENKVKFFPGVIEPYKLLNQIFQPQQFNVFYLSSGTKLQMFDGHFKYFYIFFQDGKNETRAEILRRHDLIMKEVYFVVRQLAPGAVVAFYTGKMNPVEVRKTEFVPIAPIAVTRDPGVMVVTDGGLFRFVGVYAATQTRRAMFNQIPMVAEETWTPSSLSTKMAYTDFELEFSFNFKDKGWVLDYVALLEGGEEVGRTDMGVGARWRTAYYCGEPLVVLNTRDSSSVTISEYQIQPRVRPRYALRDGPPQSGDPQPASYGAPGSWGKLVSGEERVKMVDSEPGEPAEPPPSEQPPGDGGAGGGAGADDEKGFGDSVNCGPYYNAAILTGLMVTAIFLVILFCGLGAMYDCRAYNQFDDPQGKPFFVAQEGGGGH